MAFVVGGVLAVATGLFATISGLDRDRAFYPVVMIVIASYYALFAAMGASPHALLLDTILGMVFVAVAVWSFKSSLWLVVAALAAHGIFDLGHSTVVSNPGVPSWWPQFCFTFDVALAAYLAWLLGSGRLAAAR